MFELVTDPKTANKMILEENTGRLIATLGSTVTEREGYILAASMDMYLHLSGTCFLKDKEYILNKAQGRELLTRMCDEQTL